MRIKIKSLQEGEKKLPEKAMNEIAAMYFHFGRLDKIVNQRNELFVLPEGYEITPEDFELWKAAYWMGRDGACA